MNLVPKRVTDAWSVLRGRADARMQAGNPPFIQPTITSNDLAAYVKFSGNEWPFGFYSATIDGKSPIEFSTFARCVSLISGLTAQMLTSSITIRDEKDKMKTDRRSMKTMELIRESWDGRRPAWQEWEDLAADYCTGGNGIMHVAYSNGRNEPAMFRRMEPYGSSTTQASNGDRVYTLMEADYVKARTEKISERMIVHYRWAKNPSQRNANQKIGFGPAPVSILRPALQIGQALDMHILEWLKKDFKSRIHVNYDAGTGQMGGRPVMTPDEREAQSKQIGEFIDKGQPIVTFGADIDILENLYMNEATMKAREYQIQDVARLFGVPSPMFGVDLARWGGAIEQLAKLFWRFSQSLHIGRLTMPLGQRVLRRNEKFHIDLTEMLRGDWTAMAEIARALGGSGQTPAYAGDIEIRRFFGLPAVVEGELAETIQPQGGQGAQGNQSGET